MIFSAVVTNFERNSKEMSRGFVKEGDQEEIPMVPPRASLPDGVPNYVTRAGLEQLLQERQSLMEERDRLDITGENERRIAVNFLNAKLQLLNNRIVEARVMNPGDQPKDEVRFGAFVTLRVKSTGKIQTLQIVGVDEANISKGKISFISPLARVLLNKKSRDSATLKMAGEERVFEITDISYATDSEL